MRLATCPDPGSTQSVAAGWCDGRGDLDRVANAPAGVGETGAETQVQLPPPSPQTGVTELAGAHPEAPGPEAQ